MHITTPSPFTPKTVSQSFNFRNSKASVIQIAPAPAPTSLCTWSVNGAGPKHDVFVSHFRPVKTISANEQDRDAFGVDTHEALDALANFDGPRFQKHFNSIAKFLTNQNNVARRCFYSVQRRTTVSWCTLVCDLLGKEAGIFAMQQMNLYRCQQPLDAFAREIQNTRLAHKKRRGYLVLYSAFATFRSIWLPNNFLKEIAITRKSYQACVCRAALARVINATPPQSNLPALKRRKSL